LTGESASRRLAPREAPPTSPAPDPHGLSAAITCRVQTGAGGHERRRVRRIPALPVGDYAAGAADDWNQRRDVPGVQNRIAHDVGPAGGHQQGSHSSRPQVRSCFTRPAERGKRPAILVLRGRKHIAAQQRGVLQAWRVANPDRPAVERCAIAVADDQLAQDRLVKWLPAPGWPRWSRAMKRSEEGGGGGKGAGAVDRIQDPDIFRAGVLRAVFLPENAMIGKTVRGSSGRMSSSAPRSAMVTGVWSDLVSTTRSDWAKYGRMKSPL